MDKIEAKKVLKQAFSILTKRQLQRFKVHLDRGTKACDNYVKLNGEIQFKLSLKKNDVISLCPASMATSVLSDERFYKKWNTSGVSSANRLFIMMSRHTDSKFQSALTCLTSAEIRSCMRMAVKSRLAT